MIGVVVVCSSVLGTARHSTSLVLASSTVGYGTRLGFGGMEMVGPSQSCQSPTPRPAWSATSIQLRHRRSAGCVRTSILHTSDAWCACCEWGCLVYSLASAGCRG